VFEIFYEHCRPDVVIPEFLTALRAGTGPEPVEAAREHNIRGHGPLLQLISLFIEVPNTYFFAARIVAQKY
jgi:hypothetical protein